MLRFFTENKIYLTVWTLLLTLACGFQSCNKDDSSSTYSLEESNSCFISGLQLGTLSRSVTVKSSYSGLDSTYTVKYSGASVNMRIDHLAGTITNPDSLPVGTSLRAVLVSVSFEGVLVHAPVADTTTWTAYSSSDSLNLTKPRIFRVYTKDMQDYRDYTLTIAVHQKDPTGYTWQQMPSADDLLNCKQMRATVFNGNMLVLCEQADGTICTLTPSDATTGLSWQKTICTGTAQAEINSLQSYDNSLWMSTTDGRILHSQDGATWTEQSQSVGDLHLFAASANALYAHTSGTPLTIMVKTKDQDWQAQEMEDVHELTTIETASYLKQANGIERIILLGNTTEAENLHIWSLIEAKAQEWSHFTDAFENPYVLPVMEQAILTAYDNKLYVFGKYANSSTATLQAYLSPDNGLTWKMSEQFTIPTALTDATQAMTATAWGEHLWIFEGSDVWRVRFNGYEP